MNTIDFNSLPKEIRKGGILCHFAATHRKWHKIKYPYKNPETVGSAAMLWYSYQLTDFEECFSDLYNRRVNTFEKKSSDLISKMKESATNSIKEKMSIRFENGTIYYTVKSSD